MNLNVRLEGKESEGKSIYLWHLIFTPKTSPGVFAPSNRWVVSANRVNGEVIFDRNGLHIRTNIATAANDALSMNKCERMFATLFYTLLQTYPEDGSTATVDMDFKIEDDEICQYLLNPVLTVNFERFTATQ